MKINLRMPKKELETLKKFISSPVEQQDFFIQKLNTISPESPLGVITEILDNTDFNKKEIREFLDFADSFYMNYYIFNKYNKSPDDYIQEVVIDSITDLDIELELNEHIKNNLKQILEMEDSLGVISKVTSLIKENPNNFANTRIITDLRHIYYNDPTRKPHYSLIKHTLTMYYLDIDNQFKEKFFTLDFDDLLTLRRIVDRAIEKEKSIKELCDQKDIVIIKEVDWFE